MYCVHVFKHEHFKKIAHTVFLSFSISYSLPGNNIENVLLVANKIERKMIAMKFWDSRCKSRIANSVTDRMTFPFKMN